MTFFFFNDCRFVENSSEIFENWGGKSLRLKKKKKENQKQDLSCLSDPPYEASSFTSFFWGYLFSQAQPASQIKAPVSALRTLPSPIH